MAHPVAKAAVLRPMTRQKTLRRRQSSATQEALEIYELLELILLHLPMRDLLLSQRVCSRWHLTISSSKRLQQRLFLLPRDPLANPRLAYANELLLEIFGYDFTAPLLFGGMLIYLDRVPSPKHFEELITLTSFPKRAASFNFTSVDKCPSYSSDARLRYANASWRRMLLTQPPVTHVSVLDFRVAPDYDDCFCEGAVNIDGVRMGELVDLGARVLE
ncbi:hypothetical protein CC78DRAFT_538266 [Lojkania enalia]|uniref:F-box domain-containing protein n=1 Tax=Lojkania enalia TaxID=147567 RepID=A0A9P4MXS0_9PLEO|nr:hypothetical protein CC78DRAFT_538266 [Didymosphaeria enalia]